MRDRHVAGEANNGVVGGSVDDGNGNVWDNLPLVLVEKVPRKWNVFRADHRIRPGLQVKCYVARLAFTS